jgi:hypothetical protein
MSIRKRKTAEKIGKDNATRTPPRSTPPYAEALATLSEALAKVLASAAFQRALVDFVRKGGLSEFEAAKDVDKPARKRPRSSKPNPTGKDLENKLARALKRHSAPLGFTEKEWDRLNCCFLYCIYHKFKQTKLGGQLFFDNGRRFRVTKRNVRVTGRVTQVDGYQNDGDYCFDIEQIKEYGEGPDEVEEALGRLHCEITPCDQDSLSGFIARLERRKDAINVGTDDPEVEVSGDKAYDPAHTDPTTLRWHPGGPEIHPVRGVWFLR